MTKSTTHFSNSQELAIVETAVKTPPVVSAQKSLIVTHNTNVALTLTNTATTLNVAAWKEACDFKLDVYPTPRLNKGYLDDGVVTVSSTEYPSGLIVTAGYTTAVVGGLLIQTITFAAGGHGAVQKIVTMPHKQGTIMVTVNFTDVYAVAHTISQYIKSTGNPFILDLAPLKIDRSIALSVVVYFYGTAYTGSLADNLYVSANKIYGMMFAPVKLQFSCYNSLDTDSFSQPRVPSTSFSTIKSYIKKYAMFIADHCKPFGIDVDSWINFLAQGADYAIGMGWIAATSYNGLTEVRDLSLALVGTYSKILQGDFSDPSIPSHFVNQIEAMLAENVDISKILVLAAIWAIADDIVLEVSN